MNPITNPIQTLRNQGITINTNDKEATRRMQNMLEEMSIKREEGKPQDGICVACGVGEV